MIFIIFEKVPSEIAHFETLDKDEKITNDIKA
jgi:hypothetical protein